jgi:hypothetical protein
MTAGEGAGSVPDRRRGGLAACGASRPGGRGTVDDDVDRVRWQRGSFGLPMSRWRSRTAHGNRPVTEPDVQSLCSAHVEFGRASVSDQPECVRVDAAVICPEGVEQDDAVDVR